MSTKLTKSANVNNSNAAQVEDIVKPSKGRVSQNVDNSTETANVMDAEEAESVSKLILFGKIRSLIGFPELDEQTLFATSKNFEEFKRRLADEKKKLNEETDKLENMTIEQICNIIESSEFSDDFKKFVSFGGLSLVEIANQLLISPKGKVILYHGKQSEDSEKFEESKVCISGKHKKYEDITFLSYVDYNTTNVIRAFRNFCYYTASYKRCLRKKETETNLVEMYQKAVSSLMKDFGYTIEEIHSLN